MVRSLGLGTWSNEELFEGIRYALGILSYSDESLPDKIDEILPNCIDSHPCLVLNCPFKTYPPPYHRNCKNLHELHSPTEAPPEIANPTENLTEIFLNFRYDYANGRYSVNSIKHRPAIYPPFLFSAQFENEISTVCDSDCGTEKSCVCFHKLEIKFKSLVQLVFTAITPHFDMFGHPIHLHGHHFYLLTQGYPQYDANGMADCD